MVAVVLSSLSIVLLPASSAWAAHGGTLDPTFGTDGKVLTDFAAGHSFAHGLAVQSDGKIVAVGSAVPLVAPGPLRDDFALARYNQDGTLDAGFGTDGKVMTGFEGGHSYDWAYAVAVQRDDKIVAVGSSGTPVIGFDFVLARYNADGTLDGGARTHIGRTGSFDKAVAVAIQPDGKIVAAGYALAGTGESDFALVRYNPDLSLDAGFGTGGKVLTDISGTGSSDSAAAVAIQPNGKIVAAGSSNAPGSSDFALVRYNRNGTLDAGFGTGGKVLTDISGTGSSSGAAAVVIQPDGKIVAAGTSYSGGAEQFALVRYQP